MSSEVYCASKHQLLSKFARVLKAMTLGSWSKSCKSWNKRSTSGRTFPCFPRLTPTWKRNMNQSFFGEDSGAVYPKPLSMETYETTWKYIIPNHNYTSIPGHPIWSDCMELTGHPLHFWQIFQTFAPLPKSIFIRYERKIHFKWILVKCSSYYQLIGYQRDAPSKSSNKLCSLSSLYISLEGFG